MTEDRIAELEAQLAAARATKEQVVTDSAKDIEIRHEWSAVWKTGFQVKIERRYHPDTKADINAWMRANLGVRFPWPGFSASVDETASTTYVLIGEHIVMVGGGQVLLKDGSKLTPDGWGGDFKEPLQLSKEEVNELQLGRVPESIIR